MDEIDLGFRFNFINIIKEKLVEVMKSRGVEVVVVIEEKFGDVKYLIYKF